MHNPNSDEQTTFIKSYLDNGSILFLTPTKELKPIIPQKVDSDNLAFVEMYHNKKNIGFVIQQNGAFVFYDYKFQIIDKVKSKGRISIHAETISELLPKIYKTSRVATPCFNCAGIWDNSWSLVNDDKIQGKKIPKKINNTYYLAYKDRETILKNYTNDQFEEKVDLYYQSSFLGKFKTVIIKSSRSVFFFDEKYTGNKLFFPTKYLSTEK